MVLLTLGNAAEHAPLISTDPIFNSFIPNLEEMAAEGCGDASPKPSFVKVLLPNFSTKLKLPPAFVKKNITEKEKKASRTATLLGPDGQYWKISLGNDKEKHRIYFSGKEWNKCIQVYDLQDGYFLHFCYEGKMVFNFTVYDHTACEKTYPLLTNVSETNQAAGKWSKGIRTCKEGHHHFRIVVKNRCGTKTFCCKDCSCIRFEANLVHYNITEPLMRFPVPFRELSGFSKEKHEATLADTTGRFWPVSLVHNTRAGGYGYDSHIGKGWLVFVRANQLKLGDTCAFEMEAGEKEVIKVKKINS